MRESEDHRSIPGRSRGHWSWLSCAAMLAVCGSAGSAFGQSTLEWTGGAGTSDWTDVLNWVNLGPVAAGAPTIVDTAVFPISASVRGGAAGSMQIDPSVTVTFGGGITSSTRVAGTITNEGLITFVPDGLNNNSGVIDQRLFVQGGDAATLSGPGILELAGLETGIQGDGASGSPVSPLTNAAGHSIRGAGALVDLELVQNGLVFARGGTLLLRDVLASGTGSYTIEDDGLLRLDNSSIAASTLIGEAGARIDSGSGEGCLFGVSLQGSMTVGGGGLTTVAIEGTIVNDAAVAMAADGLNNNTAVIDQRLLVRGGTSAAFQSTGSLTLDGSETGIQGEGASGSMISSLTNGVGHLIGGVGTLLDLDFVNDGVVRAVGGTLSLDGVIGSGTGLYDIASDGVLALRDASIAASTVRGQAGGRLEGTGASGLFGASLEGAFTVGGGGNTSLFIEGTIVNDAALSMTSDSLNNNTSVLDQRLFVEAGTAATLAGVGSIELNGNQTGLEGAGSSGGSMGSTLTNGAGHTISGDGVIAGLEFVNNGLVAPAGGTVALVDAIASGTGLYQIASDGTLELRAASIAASTIDGQAGALLSSRTGGGLLSDVTLEGVLDLGGPSRSTTTITDTIVNNADASMITDSLNNDTAAVDQRLFVPAAFDATIEGTGSLTLRGRETGLEGEGRSGPTTSTLTHGTDHTIVVDGDGVLSSLLLENSGTVRIDSGRLLLSDATIEGGRLEGAIGAVLDSVGGAGLLKDLTTAGEVTFGDGGNASTDISGTITNQGLLTFSADNLNNDINRVDQRLRIDAGDSAAFDGVGTLALTGTETGLEGEGAAGPGASELTNNADHFIEGVGTIKDLAATNLGTIRADGGPVRFDGVELDGVPGTIEVLAGSSVIFDGGLLQQGTINLADPTSVFDFNGSRLEVTDFTGDLDHDTGTFAPGAGGIAISTVDGDYTQIDPAVVFEIELAGAAAGAFDTLVVTGDATLAGLLDVVPLSGFTPDAGDEFLIMDIGGSRSGLFDGLGEGDLVRSFGSVDLFITYTAGDGNDVALFAIPAPGGAVALGLGGLAAGGRRRDRAAGHAAST